MNNEFKKSTHSMLRSLGQEIKRSYNYFRRPRVTIGIIAVLLVLFLSGLLIPQKELFTSPAQFEQWVTEHPVLSGVINGLKLNEIYVAPVTVFFLALFFLNLVAVLVQRTPHTLRRAYLIDRSTATAGIQNVKDDPGALSIVLVRRPADSRTEIAGKAVSYFRKRFWSVLTADDAGSFIAVKNRYSPLGFLVFHVSFLLCLVGGLLVVYTRFSGNLLLTEGEVFHSDIAQFRNITNPKILHALPELGIRLLKVYPSYVGSTGTDLNVSMQIRYSNETFEAVGKINEPVRKGAVSILPNSIGVSPLFILRNKGGEEAQGGYFSLNVLKGGEDSFQFPDLPYKISVRFYPDFYEQEGKPATRSLKILNPVFHLRVEDSGRVLYEGFRKPGEWAPIDRYELSCSEIRYWVDFLVIREYGTTPLFAGFFLGASGLILRLIFSQKTVRVHIEERDSAFVLYVNGSGEYYPQAFRDELARLTADLADALRGEGRREGAAT